jgi:hypothetical protein
MVRAFVRVESGFTLTLDLEETNTVSALKVEIEKSCQTGIPAADQLLFQASSLLDKDQATLQQLRVPQSNGVHLVLRRRRAVKKAPFAPEPKMQASGVLCDNPRISLVTPMQGEIEVRSQDDEACEGECSCEAVGGGSFRVSFLPQQPLLPGTHIACYFEASERKQAKQPMEYCDYVWGFTTMQPAPLRILICEKGSQKKKVAVLTRMSGESYLHALRRVVAARFGHDISAVGTLCKVRCSGVGNGPEGESSTIAEESSLVEEAIDSDRAALGLREHELVHFALLSVREQVTVATEQAKVQPPPPLSWEQYKREHWVNEEAG